MKTPYPRSFQVYVGDCKITKQFIVDLFEKHVGSVRGKNQLFDQSNLLRYKYFQIWFEDETCYNNDVTHTEREFSGFGNNSLKVLSLQDAVNLIKSYQPPVKPIEMILSPELDATILPDSGLVMLSTLKGEEFSVRFENFLDVANVVQSVKKI